MKKYIVRLTDDERKLLTEFVKKQMGTFQRVRRAQILLKADANGQKWTDKQIGDAFDCNTRVIAEIRKRFAERGLQSTMDGLPRASKKKLLDGEQEAKIIAMRLGTPPDGHANWTLRLLAEKAVELQICEKISYQTVKKLLKKRK